MDYVPDKQERKDGTPRIVYRHSLFAPTRADFAEPDKEHSRVPGAGRYVFVYLILAAALIAILLQLVK